MLIASSNYNYSHCICAGGVCDLLPVSPPQFNAGIFTPDAPQSVPEEPRIEQPKSPIIADYEKLIHNFVNPWVTRSEKIDPIVADQVVIILPTLAYYPRHKQPRNCSMSKLPSLPLPSNRKSPVPLRYLPPNPPSSASNIDQGIYGAIKSYTTGAGRGHVRKGTKSRCENVQSSSHWRRRNLCIGMGYDARRRGPQVCRRNV